MVRLENAEGVAAAAAAAAAAQICYTLDHTWLMVRLENAEGVAAAAAAAVVLALILSVVVLLKDIPSASEGKVYTNNTI